jgi:hypothetical protein
VPSLIKRVSGLRVKFPDKKMRFMVYSIGGQILRRTQVGRLEGYITARLALGHTPIRRREDNR